MRRLFSQLYTERSAANASRHPPPGRRVSQSVRAILRTMQAGFYTIMAAQFFSSLADSALLVAAIQMLRDLESPAWMTPSLKQVFVISYVLLAPVVGAFADSMPKGRVVLGGLLISGPVSSWLLAIDIPRIETGVETPPQAAIAVIMACYAIAALFNWYIPDTGVDRRVASKNPVFLIREFGHCCALLWHDKLGQISLATTTLFWGEIG